MAENDLLLMNLTRIEGKIDDLAKDVGSLKESRAEARGRFSTVKMIAGMGSFSAIVSYLTSLVHH